MPRSCPREERVKPRRLALPGEAIPREAIRRAAVRRRLLRPPVLTVEHEEPLELTVDDEKAAEALVERLGGAAD